MKTKPQLIAKLEKELNCTFKLVEIKRNKKMLNPKIIIL